MAVKSGVESETGEPEQPTETELAWIHQIEPNEGVGDEPNRDDRRVLEQDVDREELQRHHLCLLGKRDLRRGQENQQRQSGATYHREIPHELLPLMHGRHGPAWTSMDRPSALRSDDCPLRL